MSIAPVTYTMEVASQGSLWLYFLLNWWLHCYLSICVIFGMKRNMLYLWSLYPIPYTHIIGALWRLFSWLFRLYWWWRHWMWYCFCFECTMLRWEGAVCSACSAQHPSFCILFLSIKFNRSHWTQNTRNQSHILWWCCSSRLFFFFFFFFFNCATASRSVCCALRDVSSLLCASLRWWSYTTPPSSRSSPWLACTEYLFFLLEFESFCKLLGTLMLKALNSRYWQFCYVCLYACMHVCKSAYGCNLKNVFHVLKPWVCFFSGAEDPRDYVGGQHFFSVESYYRSK